MIRWLFRTLGTLVLIGALAAFGNELQEAASGPGYRTIPLGELWASLNANSLIGLQSAIEAASPWLWRAIVLPILMGPGWAIPLGLGLVLRLIGGGRRRRPASAPAREIARLAGALRHKAAALRPKATDTPSSVAPTPEAPPPPPRAGSTPRREPTIVRRS